MKNIFKTIVLALCLIILAGCSKDVPECTDPAVTTIMRKLMNDKIYEALGHSNVEVAKDTRGIIPKFLDSWGFKLSNISTTAYLETNHTRTCMAKVTVTVPETKQVADIQAAYALQTFEDSRSGEFELRVGPEFVSWAHGNARAVKQYYNTNRVRGVWSGVSQCTPTRFDSDNLNTAYAQGGVTLLKTYKPWTVDDLHAYPVSLEVMDGTVVMTITKPDGSKVVRSGKIDASQPYASSSFNFTQKDELSDVVFSSGYFQDDKFKQDVKDFRVMAQIRMNANGYETDANLRRTCTLNLTQADSVK